MSTDTKDVEDAYDEEEDDTLEPIPANTFLGGYYGLVLPEANDVLAGPSASVAIANTPLIVSACVRITHAHTTQHSTHSTRSTHSTHRTQHTVGHRTQQAAAAAQKTAHSTHHHVVHRTHSTKTQSTQLRRAHRRSHTSY